MPKDTSAPPVLSLDLAGKSFKGAAILGPIALNVAAGETVAITGPSGIGKSTLLRIIAGLEPAAGARVGIAGRMAMVFQEPVLLPWRTVAQNLAITAGIGPERIATALGEVGLAGLEARFPGQLSLGQQRRLSLARAFATEPDLLLLDEPFVSLDAALHDEMMALFAALRARRGTAAILVTHDAAEAEALAGRILTLGGRPATVTGSRQNSGAYFQTSASGVTASQS